MKEKQPLMAILPKHTDFDDDPQELLGGLDDIIQSMLTTLEENKISLTDLKQEKVSLANINIFSYIMSDPLLKQAVGNVAISVIMRDEKVDRETATKQVKDALPVLMGDFQEIFLPHLMHLTLPQIFARMERHTIDVMSDALRMLDPVVWKIHNKPNYMHGFKIGEKLAIDLHFEDPVFDSTEGSLDTNDAETSMFG